ncbi:uncharacterized protein BcabD6B2_52570 [Babesia caballi]|uniref:Uncharacterized protein n=1 Tax=Babesia caballi TaxID=5871 RepID=A0AAV4M177_BABCB|nr:hypothetical protein, conserved [Babesia caballi]
MAQVLRQLLLRDGRLFPRRAPHVEGRASPVYAPREYDDITVDLRLVAPRPVVGHSHLDTRHTVPNRLCGVAHLLGPISQVVVLDVVGQRRVPPRRVPVAAEAQRHALHYCAFALCRASISHATPPTSIQSEDHVKIRRAVHHEVGVVKEVDQVDPNDLPYRIRKLYGTLRRYLPPERQLERRLTHLLAVPPRWALHQPPTIGTRLELPWLRHAPAAAFRPPNGTPNSAMTAGA